MNRELIFRLSGWVDLADGMVSHSYDECYNFIAETIPFGDPIEGGLNVSTRFELCGGFLAKLDP